MNKLGYVFLAAISCVIKPVFSADIATSTQLFAVKKSFAEASTPDINTYGIYSYAGYGAHSVELEFDQYVSNSTNVQQDFAAVYSNYSIPKWQLSAGAHIADSKASSVTTSAYLANAKYSHYNDYGYVTWLSGVDLAYVTDSSSSPNDSVQASPYIRFYKPGFALTDYWFIDARAIKQSFTNTMLDKKNYQNAVVNLSYFTPKWSVELESAVAGEVINASQKGGFVLDGDNLKHGSSYALAANYIINKNFFVRASVKKQNTEDINAVKSSYTMTGIFLGFNF
jgi:hypothetical protein